MSTLCPYCGQAELPPSRGATLYLDVLARAVSIARVIFEIKSDKDAGLRQLAQGLIDPSSLPLATHNDRLCPYCRRGRVTRLAPSSVWADVLGRGVGLARRVVETKGASPSIPWYSLAWLSVDSMPVPASEEARADYVDAEVEVVEEGEGTPFDDYDEAPEVAGPTLLASSNKHGKHYDADSFADAEDW